MGIVRRKKDSREATDTKQQVQTVTENLPPGVEAAPPEIVTTVLVISYNCRESLGKCVAALEASQRRDTIEILVVDCGSTDGSGQIDSDYPEVNVLRLPRNLGRTKARNIGIRTAKGRYILFLEPGLSVRPDCIETLASALKADASTIIVSPLVLGEHGFPEPLIGALPSPSDLKEAWASGKRWESTLSAGEDRMNFGANEQVGCGDPRAFLSPKSFIKGMNYLDERFGEFGSEIELFTQAIRASKKTMLIPAAKVVVHDGQTVWEIVDSAARDTLTADYGNGIASYAGKHYGLMAGLKVRLWMSLKLLLSFRLGLLSQLLSGQKMDGSQTTL